MQPLIVAQQVTTGIADFLGSAFPSTTPGFVGLLDRFLAERDNILKGPYLTVPLPFRKQANAGQAPFNWLPAGFVPHAHQARAFDRLCSDDAQPTLVATGTGSGKTECFLYPILEHCRVARAEGRRGARLQERGGFARGRREFARGRRRRGWDGRVGGGRWRFRPAFDRLSDGRGRRRRRPPET